MISVTLYRDNNRIMAFRVSGHADSGPYGYDLVCAGVSAVTFGTVNAAYQVAGAELAIDQDERGGYIYVKVPEDIEPRKMKHVQLLLEGMKVSLQTIEQDYGQFIQIKEQKGGA